MDISADVRLPSILIEMFSGIGEAAGPLPAANQAMKQNNDVRSRRIVI
jgi:hypothetical protein